MLKKRSLTVFAVAFVVVLVSGVALAQVGSLDLGGDPDADTPETLAGDGYIAEVNEEPAKDDAVEEPKAPRPVETEKSDEPEPVEPGDEPEPAKPAEEPEPDTMAPDFGILFPEDGHHTDDKVQVFEGFVEPGASVTRGKYTAKVEGEGWRIELVLSPGENVVTLVATDAAGNQTKDTVTVYLEGHEEDKPKEEPGAVEFSANQKYGSCGEEVPYDVFYGTAAPGATIHVASPYGGGSTVAGEKGNWDLKVKFPEAPAGQPFEVVVESSDGGRKVFTFVNTGEGHPEPDK